MMEKILVTLGVFGFVVLMGLVGHIETMGG